MWKGLKRQIWVYLLTSILLSAGFGEVAAAQALANSENLLFAGYSWTIKTGYDYPGKNYWSADSVWTDDNGWLHLKLNNRGGQWQCAEIASGENFGYGLYRFNVVGAINQLDANAVLGMFLYPKYNKENQYDQEIDIEIAKWGDPEGAAGNFTVVPTSVKFPLNLQGEYTTHQFVWLPDRVEFSSFHGHEHYDDENIISKWVFKNDDYNRVPTAPLQVHINYWLFNGMEPKENLQPEIIIKNFIYVPMDAGSGKESRLQ